MDSLELIVFNVGHGLSVALIERPANYVVLVDLGSDTGFTPLKHLSLRMKLKPDILYITHPHGDHISDVDTALTESFKPLSMNYQNYDWQEVIDREKPELKDTVRSYQQLIAKIPYCHYGGDGSLTVWRYTPKEAKDNFGDADYINNSSYFIVYSWRSFKISIAGDQHSNVMGAMLNDDKFKNSVVGTNILIAPHHGHAQGYCSLWPEKAGKPYVTIISVQENDPSVASGYSSSDFARGVTFNGQTRYSLTTRYDGNIHVTMRYNNENKPSWTFESL